MRHPLLLIVIGGVVGALVMAVIQTTNTSHAQPTPPGQSGEQTLVVEKPVVNYWVFNSELNVKRKGTGDAGVTRNTILLDTREGQTWILRPAATQESYAWFQLQRE